VQFNSDQRLSVVPLRNVVTSGNLVRIGCCYAVRWMGAQCDAVVMAIGLLPVYLSSIGCFVDWEHLNLIIAAKYFCHTCQQFVFMD